MTTFKVKGDALSRSITPQELVQEQPLIGSVLGNRYRILREIGAGGMAKVYLAEDISGNELVAVKVLYPQFSQDISFIQRFNREAKLASTLTDSHIVRVLDYGADRDLQYLVMEYVEGKDLNSALKENGPFEWQYALEISLKPWGSETHFQTFARCSAETSSSNWPKSQPQRTPNPIPVARPHLPTSLDQKRSQIP